MYTHCPHCDTCFRITSEQLKIARGSVRCGRCFGTFSALEHLVDEPPHPQATPPALSSAPQKKPAPPPKPTVKRERPAPIVTPKLTPALIPAEVPSAAVKARQPPVPVPASTTTAVTRPTPPQPTVISPVTTLPPEPKAGPAPKTEVTPPPIIELEGSSAAPAPSAPASKEGSEELLTSPPPDAQQPAHKKVWLWALATPLLVLLFIGQYAWFNLDSLSQKTSLRPALQTMCGLFSCDVPLIKSPHMVTLIERNVRNHPNRKQVLQVKIGRAHV